MASARDDPWDAGRRSHVREHVGGVARRAVQAPVVECGGASTAGPIVAVVQYADALDDARKFSNFSSDGTDGRAAHGRYLG